MYLPYFANDLRGNGQSRCCPVGGTLASTLNVNKAAETRIDGEKKTLMCWVFCN